MKDEGKQDETLKRVNRTYNSATITITQRRQPRPLTRSLTTHPKSLFSSQLVPTWPVDRLVGSVRLGSVRIGSTIDATRRQAHFDQSTTRKREKIRNFHPTTVILLLLLTHLIECIRVRVWLHRRRQQQRGLSHIRIPQRRTPTTPTYSSITERQLVGTTITIIHQPYIIHPLMSRMRR